MISEQDFEQYDRMWQLAGKLGHVQIPSIHLKNLIDEIRILREKNKWLQGAVDIFNQANKEQNTDE